MSNQNVQAAEGGVILRRYVDENQRVEEGDVLFEIDPVEVRSELDRIQQRNAALKIKELRLRSEIAGERPEFPADLLALAPTVVSSEESLFDARRSELTGAISVLQQQLAQRQQQLQNAEVTIRTAQNTSALIDEEIEVMEPLVEQNIAPQTRLLELRRELEASLGRIESARTDVASAQSGINEIESQIENRRQAYLLNSMDELATVVAEQVELQKVLPALEERVGRTVIRTPVDGIVNRLNYRTPGGYVTQGDVMAEIVPMGDDLVIEARIAPQDISRIRLDDAVKIRLSAYDSTRYGTVEGRVTEISPDAIPSEEQQGESHYLIDVAIEGSLETEAGDPVEFLPGMTATVDVLSGKRSVLEYVWQPIARVQELALRD
jgi:adhesin transport system membrane fusion protein